MRHITTGSMLLTGIGMLVCAVSPLKADNTAGNLGGEALLAFDIPAKGGLGMADWFVVGIYGAFMLAIGRYCSRRQNNTEEYFLAGRNMPAILAGISIYASMLSTISYLSGPGEVIKNGPTLLLFNFVAIPIVYVIVAYGLIPAIMRLRITSAYECLETKLGIGVRLFAAILFIGMRLIWMAVLIYVAARAIVVMLGWPAQPATSWVVLICGVITVLYTMMGGLRAVIMTDMVQFVVLVGGALLTILLITWHMGSIAAWWPSSYASQWATPAVVSFEPDHRNMLGALIAPVAWWICTAGSDQIVIQRYLSTRDVKSAQRAFLFNSIGNVLLTGLLLLVGLALMGYFQLHSQQLPDSLKLTDKSADYIFPYYIAHFLPVGVAGLVVAGLFAAAMSSLDSGINSIVTVVSRDFIDRFAKVQQSERQLMKRAKIMVVVIGLVVVAVNLVVPLIKGNIIDISLKTDNLFVAPLFGLFFMALFVPFADRTGAIAGAVFSAVTAILMAYWEPIFGTPGISVLWITPIALLVTIIIGPTTSWLTWQLRKQQRIA